MALPTTTLNPTQGVAKRFTGRKGKVWFGTGIAAPTTASNRPGVKVSLDGNTATSNPNFANFAGGAAMAAADLAVTFSGTPSTGAIVEIEMPFTLDGVIKSVRFGIIVQSGDATTDVAGDIDALFTAANNGDALPANSYVKGLQGSSLATLKTAMETYFGTDETVAFVTSSSTVTFLLGTTGTAGNLLWMRSRCLNSLPSPLVGFDANGVPNIGGFQDPGDFTDFDLNIQTGSVNYTPGNTLAQVTLPTTNSLSSATGVYFNTSPQVLQAISGALAASGNSAGDVFLLGGASSAQQLQGVRFLFVFDNDNGTYDVVDLYKCFLLNTDLKYKGDAADAIAIAIAPQPIPTRAGDPFGYIYLEV